MKENYQKILDEIISENQKNGVVPSLMLHSCCAPCSSYVIEYLSDYFYITVLYFNPNITENKEYQYRLSEQKRLISQMNTKYPVSFIEGDYNPQDFFSACKGFESEKEGGKRCEKCFNLRLDYTGKTALKNKSDYFTTTLTISPLKNAQIINETGKYVSQKYGVPYLFSDFKKKEGYKRSIELSREYSLYRQDYCGCIFSKKKCSL